MYRLLNLLKIIILLIIRLFLTFLVRRKKIEFDYLFIYISNLI